MDAGTADFARRSRSRIRYIQDVGSARRQQIKVIFDYVRDHLGDARLADLDARLDLPPVKLSDPGLIGSASLRVARRRAGTAERHRVVDELTDEDREESLREMDSNMRNALRLDRANRFVEGIGLESGQSTSSESLTIQTEDDILDVLSCLVFATAGGTNHRLETERTRHPERPVLFDAKADFLVERFEVERK